MFIIRVSRTWWTVLTYMRFIIALLSLLICASSAYAQENSSNLLNPTSNQPGFLENFGQVRDFKQKPVEQVYFQANFGDKQIFITDKGLSFLFSRVKKTTRIEATSRTKKQQQIETIQLPSDSLTFNTYELERVDLVLKNSTIRKKNIAGKTAENSPIFHFYVTENLAGESVQLKSEILIKDVYPGIDWKLYIKTDPTRGEYLKYDFIVHPGANPTQIALQYSKNTKPVLSGDEIKINTIMGELLEEKPFAFQKDDLNEIPVAYNLEKNTIRYKISEYDPNQTLVIDPSIFWLTYIRSTRDAIPHQSLEGKDVETDSDGNIFVQLTAGRIVPFPTLNPGNGAYYQDYTTSPHGSMLIIKFAPGGQMLWSTFFGNGVGGNQMTVDKEGNIITVGRAQIGSPSFPIPNPSIPLRNNGGYYDSIPKTYFIAKFSNNGNLNWSSWYLDHGSYPTDMSYDVNGNIYVTGWSTIYGFPSVDPGGGAYMAPQSPFGYAQVLFISQFNAENKLTWATRIEGNAYDPLARICTDKLGNIYLGGQTRSDNFPIVNAGGYFNPTAYGSVLARFNPARKLTWSTYIPEPFALQDITTDDSGNLYVAARKNIYKFDTTTNLVFKTNINNHKSYWWEKIQYDSFSDQIQLLGVMNDSYDGFTTKNTNCNGEFFDNGLFPRNFLNASGPIFATLDHDGNFTYLSLADWGYEYYQYNEMAIDRNGNTIYLFGNNNNYSAPNPDATNPGNGAYFNSTCGCEYQANPTSMLLKLEPSLISIKAEITSANGCNCDASVLVTPECGVPPFTYKWSTGNETASLSGLCPGNYWVSVKDGNNLSRKISINIPTPPGAVTSTSASIIPENCTKSNGSIAIEAVQGGTAPYTYSIDGINFSSNSTFASLDSGSYVIYVKDHIGCTFSDTILLGRVKGPQAISVQTQSSTCIGADGQVEVTNVQGGAAPYQYLLSGASANNTGIFKNLLEGSYQLTVTDSAGCSLSSYITITQTNPPTDVLFTTGKDPCKQGKGFILITQVNGGATPYIYSTDGISYTSDSLKNLRGGIYIIYIKDKNGCIFKKENVVVEEQSGPTNITSFLTHAYCGNLSGSLTVEHIERGTAPYSFSVDNGPFTTTTRFTDINPGIHQIEVRDSSGCRYATSFQINFMPLPNLYLIPADTTVCYGENITLRMLGELQKIKQIQWNIPSENLSANLKVNDEKRVIVTITDSNACIIRDTAIIKPKPCNPPEKCLVIPTAFTPNNDGKNETIGPIANGCPILSVQFYIYNRWGEPIFETKDLIKKWDGKYRNVIQPQGPYFYLCIYVTEDGIRRQQKGNILLVR